MILFWRNPELVRHARAKLRLPRVVGIPLLVLLLHALIALSVWIGGSGDQREHFRAAYLLMGSFEAAVFILWCAFSCGRAVPSERQARTYDFLRITRLTPRELMLGKVLGEPIPGFYFLACSVPFGAVTGALAGYSLGSVAGTYTLLLALGVFAGLLALFMSMFLERGAGGAAALMVVLPFQSFAALATQRPLSGFAALSVGPAVLDLHGLGSDARPTIFGFAVPYYASSLLLLVVFGSIIALAIERNLKRDLETMVAFSRRQTLLVVAVLNALFYSLLDPALVGVAGGISPAEIAGASVVLNAALLFLAALTLVTPAESLKAWSRRYVASQERYVSEIGPPWPWLILVAGLAYGLFLVAVFMLRRRAPLGEWPLTATAIEAMVLLAFGLRDVLFIQWCRLTRLRKPITAAVLLVALYYLAVAVVAAATWLRSPDLYETVLGLTPIPALLAATHGVQPSPAIWVGAAMQLVLAVLLLRSISNRVRRPSTP